jgi:tetratricopeptide (TPR) repeat protein
MKKIVFILIFFTTVFAQTSAMQLFDESRQALSNGNLELAGEKIREAIDADKGNDQLRKEFDRLNGLRNKANNSNRAVQDGRFGDAIVGFKEVLDSIPKYIPALFGLAKAYEGKKDYIAAITYYKQSLSLDSNYNDSKKSIQNIAKKLYNSANKDYKNGDLEGAMSKYRQVLDINNRFYQAHFALGILYKSMGNISQAIQSYETALSIYKFDKGWYNLGLAHKANGDFNNAKKAFEETVKLNKKYYKAHKSLGEIFIDLEQYEDAVASLKAAISIKSNYSAAWHALGVTYGKGKLEDYNRSVEALSKAVDLKPREMLSWFHLSEAYNELRECEKAKEAALEAIDLKKNFGGGWFQLGIAEYCNATGNKNNAINHFDRARNDRQWRKMAEYEIDRVRNPEKYE